MSRLLNALLDISKLESGAIKLELTDFEVAAIFDELRSEFASLAARKGLDLQVESSAQLVYSDPSLVEQILRNLLSNAIKYTRAGRIILHCMPDGDSKVRIEVTDTGIGIPSDQLPYIYDEFYQVGVPTNSTRDGYGLGLSIVQRLVELLNLGFDVRSEPGKGSAFTLVLPGSLAQPCSVAATGRPTARTTARQAGKLHVLLVEDDNSVRDATRMLFRVEGFRVSAVSSLGEAQQIARENSDIDLLVTDYHLGGSDTGTQLVASLREQLRRPLKAVLITGDTSSAVRELAVDELVRVASKPIEADELLTMMRELLAR
jgi:signal transduction histidine kinase